MHSTVFLPTTDRGRVNSTRRSAAERAAAASDDTWMPGAIAPPRNSPFPTRRPRRWTTRSRRRSPLNGTRWNAARQLTIRSAPTSLGLSTSSGIPVRTPGSISTCGTEGQYCSSITRISCSTDGTVDRPVAPVSRSASSPMSPSMVSASSSAVTSDSVRIRQLCTTLAWSPEPETSPTTVWVLRTSMASSTAYVLRNRNINSSRVIRDSDPTRPAECPSMPADAPMSIAMLSSSLVVPSSPGNQQAGRALAWRRAQPRVTHLEIVDLDARAPRRAPRARPPAPRRPRAMRRTCLRAEPPTGRLPARARSSSRYRLRDDNARPSGSRTIGTPDDPGVEIRSSTIWRTSTSCW